MGLTGARYRKIPSGMGKHAFNKTLAAAKPRYDLKDGVWPLTHGTMPGTDEKYFNVLGKISRGVQLDLEYINSVLETILEKDPDGVGIDSCPTDQ